MDSIDFKEFHEIAKPLRAVLRKLDPEQWFGRAQLEALVPEEIIEAAKNLGIHAPYGATDSHNSYIREHLVTSAVRHIKRGRYEIRDGDGDSQFRFTKNKPAASAAAGVGGITESAGPTALEHREPDLPGNPEAEDDGPQAPTDAGGPAATGPADCDQVVAGARANASPDEQAPPENPPAGTFVT